jgi:hypothetical protein
MRAFESATPETRRVIVYALYYSHVPEALPFMDSVAFGKRAKDVDGWDVNDWTKAFLVKHCDRRVLREYSRQPFEIGGPGGSYEYSLLIPYFAKCRHDAAIPHLIWLFTHAASLNITLAALDALRVFYPSDVQFDSLAHAKRFYAGRYKAEPKPSARRSGR